MKKRIEDITIPHPDFRGCVKNGADGFPVLVFERPLWIKPTDEQVADYRERERQVKALGGRMVLMEHEIAGEAPRFTEGDCKAIKRLVRKTLPRWAIRDEWNGVGCTTYSVSIERKPQKEPTV